MATGISSIGHDELFAVWHISLIVGNVRGVCDWKDFLSIGLYGRSL